MPEIKEFSIAVKAAEDWIDDLQRRLGWHDRERAYHDDGDATCRELRPRPSAPVL